MGHKWAKDCVHVNYGVVSLPSKENEGEKVAMSTRAGNVLLLDDVVTAAQDSMYAKMMEDAKGTWWKLEPNKTGKLKEITEDRGEDPKAVADLIGLSACVAADFGAKRIKDYVVSINFIS